MKQTIHIELLPNFEADDFEIIKKLSPNKIDLNYRYKIESFFSQFFPRGHFFFFKSARAALTAILLFLRERFQKNEVYNQAFTCLVVPNSIKFAGLKVVYVDTEKNKSSMSVDDLMTKINPADGLAIIVQNTFGIPDDIYKIREIAQANGIFLIENLAHAFGAKVDDKFLGDFGDFAILSFDNTKIISCLSGGLLVINRNEFVNEFQSFYENLEECNRKEVIQRIRFALFLKKIKKIYHPYGKLLLFLGKKLNLTPRLITKDEYLGSIPKNYLAKFSPMLYPLLWNQLKKLFRFNKHRQEIAQLYLKHGLTSLLFKRIEEAVFLRYPLTSLYRDEILTGMKKRGVYLGDWYYEVIHPAFDPTIFDYKPNLCPQAEKLTSVIFNLPTHINIGEKEVETIVEGIYEILKL